MEERLAEIDIEQRKASLLSRNSVKSDKNGNSVDPPRDKYHLLHLVFFIMGTGSFVPMSFFLSANDYWMFKFRDLNEKTYDPSVKNILQKNFQSTSMVISAISSVITNIISSLFAHKLTQRARLVGSMCFTVIFFILYTGLVEIDTDTWQLGFFILSMVLYFLNNIACSLFSMTNMATMSKFPPLYLKTNLYGGSLGLLMGSVVQIICLAIGGTSTQVALIYFTVGTIICIITLITAYSVHFIPRFNFYLGDAQADTKKPMPTWAEIEKVSINIWPQLLCTLVGCIGMTMSGNSISSLIISDHYKRGDPWTDKYFIPVLAFLLPGVSRMIARIVASPIVNKSNVYTWLGISFVHALGVAPLMLFCNSNSKNHLPTLFPKDWQYIILQILSSFGGSYFNTTCYLSLPEFAGDMPELTFLVLTTMTGIFLNGASPLASLWVNIM